MFEKSYQRLSQNDTTVPRTPGLFVSADSYTRAGYHKGLSFDYIPNVSENDFSGMWRGLHS